jgi:hypothetical protein
MLFTVEYIQTRSWGCVTIRRRFGLMTGFIARLHNMLPITVAPRSKASNVFALTNAGITGSNRTQGMDVCLRLFCVCAVLCVGSGLATG